MAQAMLRITLTKSAHGYEADQMDTARALGLRRLRQSVVRQDTPSLRGMVRKITHLVTVEPVTGAQITPTLRRHRRPGGGAAAEGATERALPPAPPSKGKDVAAGSKLAKATVNAPVKSATARAPAKPAKAAVRTTAKPVARQTAKSSAPTTKTLTQKAPIAKANAKSKTGKEPKAK